MRERKGEISIKLLGDKVHGMSMFLLEKILAEYARKTKDQTEVYISKDPNDNSYVYVSAKAIDNNRRKLEPFIYQTYENDTTIPDQMCLQLLNINSEICVVENDEILEIAKKQEEKRREDILNGPDIYE